MVKKKFALVLSGCGQHDGTETHECILTLLALAEQGIEWDAFAPDTDQEKVVNHYNEAETGAAEKRNALVESARLVRGRVQPLSSFDASQYGAVIFPGGVGAVATLCNFFEKGAADFDFHPELRNFIDRALSADLAMGFICIAPVMMVKLFEGVKLTIGNDPNLAQQINKQGCEHIECNADDIVCDDKYRVVSTPANMVAQDITEVRKGIYKLVAQLVEYTQ